MKHHSQATAALQAATPDKREAARNAALDKGDWAGVNALVETDFKVQAPIN